MKLTIDGNEEQIKNVLQAICGSKEHNNTARILMNADGTVNHYHSEGCSEISRDRKALLAATKGTPSASELKFSLSHKSPKESGKDQD